MNKHSYSVSIEALNGIIQSKDYKSLLGEIECIFDESLGDGYLKPLQQAVEGHKITGQQIISFSKIHNRPHPIMFNPRAVIRRVNEINM